MAFTNAKIIRIIPDQEGRGGSKTSLTTQSINLDIRLASDVVVNYGRWRQATQAILPSDIKPYENVQQSYAVHDFAQFDTTNANLPPLDRILSHNLHVNGEQQIVQHQNVFSPLISEIIIKAYTPSGPIDSVPATFLNIKNRCFICWAATENFIYTGKSVYDVGVDAPRTAATYQLGNVVKEFGYATPGSDRVTLIQNAPPPITNAVQFVSIDGTTYATRQPNPLDTGPFVAPGVVNGTIDSDHLTVTSPTPWPTLYNGLTLTVDGVPYIILGYTTTTSGGTTTIVVRIWWQGQTRLMSSPSSATYTITGTQIVLGETYRGNPTTSLTDTGFDLIITNTPVLAYDGPLFWGANSPLYSYAYYDSPFMIEHGTASGTVGTNQITIAGGQWGLFRYLGVTIQVGSESYTVSSYFVAGGNTVITTVENLAATYTNAEYSLSGSFNEWGTGHVSNASPRTYVTEKNQSAVSVVLSNIMPSRVEDQGRYNKILIFRTLLDGGGAPLFPFDPEIGMLDNVGTAPLTFTDIYDDSYLLQTEPGFQEPAAGDNRKPPPFAHQQYWDGRVWGNPVSDPSAIVYSGDSVRIQFGVPEECYPSDNILRIPCDDGRVTGMALMGPLIIIATERYAYYVSGSGQVANPYRLVRFSTLMYGVGDKQMIEFAGATTDDADLLLYIGKDKRFYLTAPSVGNITISDPVQDAFNLGIGELYSLVRLANIAISGQHYLVVALGWTYYGMIYDWTRKVWYNHHPQLPDGSVVWPQAFCTVFGSATPVRFLFIYNGTVYEWLGDNNAIGANGQARPYVETMPLGGDRKARKQLDFIRIYVSDPGDKDDDGNYTSRWQLQGSVNEKDQLNAYFIEYPDDLRTIQPPGAAPVDQANAKELMFVPASNQNLNFQGYRFQIRVIWPDSTVVRDLYAVDIGYTDLEPPDQTSI